MGGGKSQPFRLDGRSHRHIAAVTPVREFAGGSRAEFLARPAATEPAPSSDTGDPLESTSGRRLAYMLGSAFAQYSRLEDLVPAVVSGCRQLLNAETVTVLFYDAAREELYCPYVVEADPIVAGRLSALRLPADKGITGTSLRFGLTLRVDDAAADPRFYAGMDEQTGRVTRAMLSAPLMWGDRILGVIDVRNPRDGTAFDDADLLLLQMVAESLAAAIAASSGLLADPAPESAPVRRQPSANVFRREGEFWTVIFVGQVARLRDMKGLQYIAHLLRHPRQDFVPLDLASEAPCAATPARSDENAGVRGANQPLSLLDTQAKSAYKLRLKELRDELSEAEAHNDIGRAQRTRAEIECLTEHLASAIGLGGRDRPVGSDAERARVAVTKRIKAAIQKIRAAHPQLGRHLAATITTGYFCSYLPDADTIISWLL